MSEPSTSPAGCCDRLAIDKEIRSDALLRLRSIRGHLDGVVRMLEREDVYCVDALKQIKAVQGGLAKTSDTILRGHLKHHVVTAHERGDEETIVAELMDVLKYR